MLRRSVLLVAFIAMGGCAPAAPQPVVWYILSPPATGGYPHGNLNTPVSTWDRLREFPTESDCQKAILDVHNEVHRPVNCVASDDARMRQ
jgi:hypothetical protein